MVFVFDWDGTLGGTKSQLSGDSKVAIKKFKKMGHEVIVATGRHPEEILEKLDNNKNICKYIIGANGAIILDKDSYEKVFVRNIDKQDFNMLLEDIRNFKEHISYVKAVQANRISRFKNPNDIFVPNEETKLILSQPHATLGIEFAKKNKLNEVVSYWQQKYGNKLQITISKNNFVNFNHINANKWTAIQWVVKKINKNNEKIIAIGDSMNDYKMLENAHIGIAMGNAKSKLRSIADITIGHTDKAGILRFVEELEKNPELLFKKN